MTYNIHCSNCPYKNQSHLVQDYITDRMSPPIILEDNNSDILLVLQAPGVEEWSDGLPIRPTKKRGGSAGQRLELSWQRKNRKRQDFDIINVVQCFPGNDGDRDLKPNIMATCSCSNRLLDVLMTKAYKKIIVFGVVAKDVVTTLKQRLNYNPLIVESKHPSGGVKNVELDDLWKESSTEFFSRSDRG